MSFTYFHARIMSGDTLTLWHYPPNHEYFTLNYYVNGQQVNIIKDVCISGQQHLLASLTYKDQFGRYLYPNLNMPHLLKEAIDVAVTLYDPFSLNTLLNMGAPTHGLLRKAIYYSEDRALYLLDKIESLDVDEVGISGTTPLMIAANLGHIRLVRKILDQGADPNLMEYMSDYTAYDYAVARGHNECAKLLKTSYHETRVIIPQFIIKSKLIAYLNLKQESDPDRYPPKQIQAFIDIIQQPNSMYSGICSGMSALFAFRNRQNKSNDFKKDIQTICSWNELKVTDKIERIFKESIEPALFMQDLRITGSPHIEQNWAKLYKIISGFDIKNEINISFMTHNDAFFRCILRVIDYNKRMIKINSNNHAISISYDKDHYVIYNSNSNHGPREFFNTRHAANYIKVSLSQFPAITISIFSLELDNLSPSKGLVECTKFASQAIQTYGSQSLQRSLNSCHAIGSLIDTRIIDYISPLMLAVYGDNLHSVMDILKFKHLLDMTYAPNLRSILFAATFASNRIITVLLENLRFPLYILQEAFYFIIIKGKFNLAAKFVDAGLDTNIQHIRDINIGERICQIGDYKTLKDFVTLGFKLNAYNGNILYKAYKSGGIDFVVSIVKDGLIHVNSNCSVNKLTLPDYLLNLGRIFEFEKLVPWGAKPRFIEVNSRKVLSQIYLEYGFEGLLKLDELYPKMDIRWHTRLMLMAARKCDTDSIVYLKNKGMPNTSIASNIYYLYESFGIKHVTAVYDANVIDFSQIQEDIIGLAVAQQKYSDARKLVQYRTKVKSPSIMSITKTLCDDEQFYLLESFAQLATSQGLNVLRSCGLIFNLLKHKELKILKNILRNNIFDSSARKVLMPVIKSSIDRGFVKTIILLHQSVAKETLQPILDEVLIYSLKKKIDNIAALLIRLGADQAQMIKVNGRSRQRLADYSKVHKMTKTSDMLSKHHKNKPELTLAYQSYIARKKPPRIERSYTLSQKHTPNHSTY